MIPDVSFILPAYNVASYIRRALASILTQTGFTYEIIVVNDGSTDETEPIVKQEFPQAHVIHQANQGSGPARNTGLAAARGRYVLFMDPDDALTADSLQHVLARAAKDEDMIIFGLDFYYPSSDSRQALSFQLPEKKYQAQAEIAADLYVHYQQGTYTQAWNKLIRRDFLLSHPELRFPARRTGQDVAFSVALWASCETAYWTPEPCYLYTLARKDSASQKHNPQMVEDNAYILAQMRKHIGNPAMQRIFNESIVLFGLRELRHLPSDLEDFRAFKHNLSASPLHPYFQNVRSSQLSFKKKIHWLIYRIPRLAYLYYRRNL